MQVNAVQRRRSQHRTLQLAENRSNASVMGDGRHGYFNTSSRLLKLSVHGLA